MRDQKFGIEIEMTGLTRGAAAQVLAGHFHTEAVHVGGGYDTYTVRDGRTGNGSWSATRVSTARLEAAEQPVPRIR